MRPGVIAASVAGLTWLAMLGACHGAPTGDGRSTGIELELRRALAAVGSKVLVVPAISIDGDSVNLAAVGGPHVVLVVHEADCFSCANVTQDAWTLHRWSRRRNGMLSVLIVADAQEGLHRASRQLRLPVSPYRDHSRWADRVFGKAVHPLVAFIAPDGTIVSLADRSGRLGNFRPLASILDAIDQVLVEPVEQAPATSIHETSGWPAAESRSVVAR